MIEPDLVEVLRRLTGWGINEARHWFMMRSAKLGGITPNDYERIYGTRKLKRIITTEFASKKRD